MTTHRSKPTGSVGLVVAAAVLAVLLLAALLPPPTPATKRYVGCVTHGWPPEVCAGRAGWDAGSGK